MTQAVVAHKSSTGLKYNKHLLVSNVSPVGSGCGIGGFFAPFMGPGWWRQQDCPGLHLQLAEGESENTQVSWATTSSGLIIPAPIPLAGTGVHGHT